jgi:hypothetical protein
MASERAGADERQAARVQELIEEFRAAQRRRLVQLGIARWKRTVAAQVIVSRDVLTPDKLH